MIGTGAPGAATAAYHHQTGGIYRSSSICTTTHQTFLNAMFGGVWLANLSGVITNLQYKVVSLAKNGLIQNVTLLNTVERDQGYFPSKDNVFFSKHIHYSNIYSFYLFILFIHNKFLLSLLKFYSD